MALFSVLTTVGKRARARVTQQGTGQRVRRVHTGHRDFFKVYHPLQSLRFFLNAVIEEEIISLVSS